MKLNLRLVVAAQVVCAFVLIAGEAWAQGAAPAVENGNVPPPTKPVMLGTCPEYKQVVLVIPLMDPKTGTQQQGFDGNTGQWAPLTQSVDLGFVPTYGANGACPKGGGSNADIWDAGTTQRLLNSYRDEVLDALKNTVTSAAIKQEQLEAIETTLTEEATKRVAGPLLKEIADLKTRIDKLEAAIKALSPQKGG